MGSPKVKIIFKIISSLFIVIAVVILIWLFASSKDAIVFFDANNKTQQSKSTDSKNLQFIISYTQSTGDLSLMESVGYSHEEALAVYNGDLTVVNNYGDGTQTSTTDTGTTDTSTNNNDSQQSPLATNICIIGDSRTAQIIVNIDTAGHGNVCSDIVNGQPVNHYHRKVGPNVTVYAIGGGAAASFDSSIRNWITTNCPSSDWQIVYALGINDIQSGADISNTYNLVQYFKDQGYIVNMCQILPHVNPDLNAKVNQFNSQFQSMGNGRWITFDTSHITWDPNDPVHPSLADNSALNYFEQMLSGMGVPIPY